MRVPTIESIIQTHEKLKSDYRMARQTRFRQRRVGLPSLGAGADYHYRHEGQYLSLIEQARDIDRNNVVVKQGINRLVANILQEGFRLDPRTSDRGLNSELISRWREWADSPKSAHVAGEYDFAELARFVLRQTIVDGDILVLPLENGALQLIEAHRLRTPRNTARNVVHGVLLDELRTPIEYWVTRDDVDPMKSVSRVADMARYPARDEFGNKAVFH